MGVKTAPDIAEKLMADGLAPDMPIAVIENAARPTMRVLRGPLAELPDLVTRERVCSPALIIIGEVTARPDVAVQALAAAAFIRHGNNIMKLVTGNDLKSGAVTWWTGEGWSIDVADAVDAGDDAETIAAREEATRAVNVPYIVEASMADGVPRPAHIKDRVRALGPTVRMDLSLQPDNPAAAESVV